MTQLTQDQIKSLSAVELLDLDMDMIPDAPDFVNPQTGIYLCDMKLSQGTYDSKVYKDGQPTGEVVEDVKLTSILTIKEVLDVAEADLDGDALPNAGDMFTVRYFGRSGMQSAKTELAELGAALNVKKLSVLAETLRNNPAEVVIALRRTKREKDGQTYLGVKVLSLTLNTPAAQ